MITTSCSIHFGTAEMIKKRKKSTIITSLKQIIDSYNSRGFKVKHVLANWQFWMHQKNQEHEGIIHNITAHDEHVPEVERYIHTIKERTWSTINTLPFEKYPHRLIVKIIYNTVFWIAFHAKTTYTLNWVPGQLWQEQQSTMTNTAKDHLVHMWKYMNNTTIQCYHTLVEK